LKRDEKGGQKLSPFSQGPEDVGVFSTLLGEKVLSYPVKGKGDLPERGEEKG